VTLGGSGWFLAVAVAVLNSGSGTGSGFFLAVAVAVALGGSG
jgi:hypothetical protein